MSDAPQATEGAFCAAVMRDRFRRSTVCPRYTPRDWFECDVCEITGVGTLIEHEVKLTRRDFEADKKKAKEHWRIVDRPEGGRRYERFKGTTKHLRLSEGDESGPAMFYFVTPPDLITKEELPPWAGWAVVDWCGYWYYRIVRDAPRLHRAKANPAEHERIQRNAYYRYCTLFMKTEEALR